MIIYKKRFILLTLLFYLIALMSCKKDINEQDVISILPKDGVYTENRGDGGSYKDPIHGFYLLEPPPGYKIVERRDKTTITVQAGEPHAGEKLPRSWIQFKRSKAEIAVIARKTYTPDIETDFEFVLNALKAKSPKELLTRYVKIDDAKGGEHVAIIGRQYYHLIKYKKYGLDHAISLICSKPKWQDSEKVFIDFVKNYRSLKAE